jgi:FMN-dependent NADH-azoreductase
MTEAVHLPQGKERIMSKLLYIEASPRVERSYSISVAKEFLDAYQEANPDDEVKKINLFHYDMVPFDGLAVQAKYTILHGKEHSAEERRAWDAVEKIIDEFKSADKYLLSTPMWNFSVPYRLKQYIDLLVQPGYTFSFTPEEGYVGLVTDKPLCAIYARGGEYPAGTDYEAFDMQKKYIETIFGFMGFTDIRPIIIEPTLQGGPDVAKAKREEAMQQARELAKGC